MKKKLFERKAEALEELYLNGRAKLLVLYRIAKIYYCSRIGDREFGENWEDVVDGIVEKLLTGSREWDVDEVPDAFVKVKSFIRSEVSNLIARNTDKFGECLFEKGADCDGVADELSGFDVEFGSDGKLRVFHDERVFVNECVIEDLKFVLRMYGGKNDYDVFERWCADVKNKDIARELGIKVSEVSNAKKRTLRTVKSLELRVMN